MLPRVRINYANGTLGQVAAMADGCLGMMALGAKEVTGDDKFKLGKVYAAQARRPGGAGRHVGE